MEIEGAFGVCHDGRTAGVHAGTAGEVGGAGESAPVKVAREKTRNHTFTSDAKATMMAANSSSRLLACTAGLMSPL